MRKSVLVRSFLDGSDIGGKIKLSAVCRLAVLHDVICHAVFQFSLSYGRIIWQLLVHLRIRRKCESCEQCSENQNEFSHIQYFKLIFKITCVVAKNHSKINAIYKD